MVLFLEEERQTAPPGDALEIDKKFSRIHATSQRLHEEQPTIIGSDKLLYVMQREFAVVSPADSNVDILGSEDATTCHLMVLRHSGSGVTCLAHLDGSDTEGGVRRMLTKVVGLSRGSPEGRLELHLFGGFIDERGESVVLFRSLLSAFHGVPEEVHLETACVCEVNDSFRGGVHWPIVYGIAVECKTGRLYSATFADKGPDVALRGARHFVGTTRRKLLDVYATEEQRLSIESFEFEPWDDAPLWLKQPDSIILKYLSTSPAQEPPGYVSHIRNLIRFVVDNPSLAGGSFFRDGRRVYGRGPSGQWTLQSSLVSELRS